MGKIGGSGPFKKHFFKRTFKTMKKEASILRNHKILLISN